MTRNRTGGRERRFDDHRDGGGRLTTTSLAQYRRPGHNLNKAVDFVSDYLHSVRFWLWKAEGERRGFERENEGSARMNDPPAFSG
jgi:hypothetical protein